MFSKLKWFLKRIKCIIKYKTFKLNSLHEPRADTVLEVHNGYHTV